VYNPKKMKGVVAVATAMGDDDDDDDSDDNDDTQGTAAAVAAVTKHNSNRKQPILSGKCFL
jgi:hypothetical protein